MKKMNYMITDKSRNLVGKIVKKAKNQHELYLQHRKDRELTGRTVEQMYHDIRIRYTHATVAMKISDLTLAQVTDVIDSHCTELTPKEMIAIKNAYEAYNQLYHLHFDSRASTDPYSVPVMQHLHGVFMKNLTKDAGYLTGKTYRELETLVEWVKESKENMLIKACVFHYELITSKLFSDGGEHIARMWQMFLLNQNKGVYVSHRISAMTIICERRQEYFDILAIDDKTIGCTKFIEFVLQAILDGLTSYENDPTL